MAKSRRSGSAQNPLGADAGPKSTNWSTWGIVGATILVAGLAAFFVTARATDASSFCPRCHEMQPHYQAWTQGAHKTQAQCVDCHVNPGIGPRLAHKFVALGEVWSHFTGNTDLPRPKPATVPDRRCVRCHPAVDAKKMPAGFSHEAHAKAGPCELCHATTGHDVTAEALQAAGVYNAQNAALRVQSTGAVAVANGGRANVAGHPAVECSRCHDMAATGCPACHKPPHEPRGDCQQCHKPGPKFVFAHPATQMEGWQKIPCKKCHPTSYAKVNCTCHPGGVPQED